jgi:phage terminase large subunit-like protein
LNATRVSSHPDLIRAAVGVDPSGGAGQCGIIGGGVAKIGKDLHGYTLLDNSTPNGTSSRDWGVAVLRTFHAIGADVIFVEGNFGGDMAENTIRTAVLEDGEGNIIIRGANVPIQMVHASRGKEVRAQPVASLFEQGRLHHVGHFPELEKQWTKWEPGDKPSPDRLDAEVWIYSGLQLVHGNVPLPDQPEQPSRWSVDKQQNGAGRWRKY